MARQIPNEFFLVPKVKIQYPDGDFATRDACGQTPDFYVVENFHATFDTICVVPKQRLTDALERIAQLEAQLSDLRASFPFDHNG